MSIASQHFSESFYVLFSVDNFDIELIFLAYINFGDDIVFFKNKFYESSELIATSCSNFHDHFFVVIFLHDLFAYFLAHSKISFGLDD